MTGNISSAPSGASPDSPDTRGKLPLVVSQPAEPLSPAAQRALAEAEARRAEIDRKVAEQPKELHGRRGPDPVRYGDWEVKGIACDF
jgi:hypothetical protein